MSLLEKMYNFYDSDRETRRKRDEFAGELISKLEEELRNLDPAVRDEDIQLIEDGYGYLKEEDNNLQHISRELWKGFVIGFIAGHDEARVQYETDLEYLDPDLNDPDDCLCIPDNEINNISFYLERVYNTIIRLVPAKEKQADA